MEKRIPEIFQQPVLLQKVIAFLNIKPGEVYLDCTIGGAGHSIAILEKGGKVFGLDRDPEAVTFSYERLTRIYPKGQWQVVKADFADLENIISKYRLQRPAGILLDLGVSLHQLKSKGRGFSIFCDEPLDMRMDPELKVKALDLINGLHEGELCDLFYRFAEEKLALPIAKAIVYKRKEKPITGTKELAQIVSRIYKRRYKTRSKIHPATKVFQALRICVNDELNNLKKVLPQTIKVLKPKGRLVVLSFHNLEDNIIKNFLKQGKEKGCLEILSKKPIVPDQNEIRENPRCRSAKLWPAEKV